MGTVVASNVSRRAPVREASIEHNYYYERQRDIVGMFSNDAGRILKMQDIF